MKISINNLSLLLITLLTTSCTMINENSNRLCADDDGNFYQCEELLLMDKEKKSETNLFKPGTNFQTINEYTEQMVHVLFQKISQKNIEQAIAVPPFIYLSSTEEDNQLNTGIAEAFVVDMQNIGLPVAEFALTNASDEEQRDFLSYLEALSESPNFGYVLKGTMRERGHGTMIYAKIINVKTKKVIASTSKFLPKYLASLLQ